VGLFGLLLLGFSMGAILVLRGLPVSLFIIKKKNGIRLMIRCEDGWERGRELVYL
jgi:ethanolamine transporter EutH